MQVTLSDGKVLDCCDEVAHDGGEGQVYLTRDGKSVAKLYHKESAIRRSALTTIIGRLNAVAGSNTDWRDLLCWPEGIVVRPKLGVIMPRVPDELRTLNWFLGPKTRAHLSSAERGSWDSHILIAMRVARAVRRLHQLGLCHSDLSPNNCMADARDGRTRLIDMDGLVVPGLLPPTVQGTDGYMAPEIVDCGARPSTYTDLHSLAVLIYQTLLFRHPLKGPKYNAPDPTLDDRLSYGKEALYIENPCDTSNHPRGAFVSSKVLGAQVTQMMNQAFTEGLHNPSRRPLAAEWEEALSRLFDRILPCMNPSCEMKFFVFAENQPMECPWCGTNWRTLPSLAVLELHRPVSGRRGYSPDRYGVVAWPGRQLFEWHTLPGRSPGPGANHDPAADFAYDRQGRWLLQNRSSYSFIALAPSQAKREVKPGEEIILTNDLRLILGPEDTARLALVRLITLQPARKG